MPFVSYVFPTDGTANQFWIHVFLVSSTFVIQLGRV